MSKGDNRRPENRAAVERNWPFGRDCAKTGYRGEHSDGFYENKECQWCGASKAHDGDCKCTECFPDTLAQPEIKDSEKILDLMLALTTATKGVK